MQLPGSYAWSCQSEFGTILIEEFRSGPFTIRFGFFRFFKKMGLYWQENIPVVKARIAVKNNWLFRSMPGSEVRLHEGQSVFYKLPANEDQLFFDGDKEYRSVDAMCTPGKLKGFRSLFPGLDDFLETLSADDPSLLSQNIRWATPAIIDIIRSIERCPFQDSLREYYLEHKVEELMLLLLDVLLRNNSYEGRPAAQEVRAAHAAERIIMQDIMKHIPIRVLAGMVQLNEVRLKQVFKQEFEEGIFEHLLNARMREAHRLLAETNKPIKEIASLIGYCRTTSFITAFRKHFDYTPGSMRRTIQ